MSHGGAGALGPTHYDWTPQLRAIVREVETYWPGVKCNTYDGHPFAGWDRWSLDVWHRAGRGHPLDYETGLEIRKFLMRKPGAPWIRHTIYINTIWTSWGGRSWWAPEDHKGPLRHLHVTYYPH